jgi:hypothetical protein
MDTLQHRLAELAELAPTDGAPPSELWERGRRNHRMRAAALTATMLIVGGLGIGLEVRLAEVDGNPPASSPAGSVGIELPIRYPATAELSELGDTPGPLTAIWVAAGPARATETVGLVAATGEFGTLPIGPLNNDNSGAVGPDSIALSTDGRMLAYLSPSGELIVHDLVSGDDSSPLTDFRTRAGFTWADATQLVGLVAGGSDADGWVWEPGAAPELVDYWSFAEGFDLWVSMQGGGPQSCWSPILLDGTGDYGSYAAGWGYTLEVPALCDVLGIIGSDTVLGHWKDPRHDNRTVIALDLSAPAQSSEDSQPGVLVSAEGPPQVTFASDLIKAALDAAGGTS